ncbi:ATP phosphoribosyltransferase regulatory subunit [Alkalihalobacillus clausii]|uniref:ATP phosphoribosyltransferase regulatory subunit n=1 Tax=Shouchella clausii TaxID=79880 RepID=UPI000BA6A84B|nr:ATP phosphoribosyltransferase regulatory subunit [Shouchella clausii]MCM3551153.1 ATP phosphoribosyltransferase regulatory subunit [Shouchella clausii]PAF12588.1 ATP phosphoribosyltransferase regulatory subunit [Shouchella clausii]
MSEPFMFEKPLGMRDVLPNLHSMQRKLGDRVLQEFRLWGYEQVQTPTLEYYETVGKASAISDKQLFKLIDFHGNTLVLRPDMTAPIARLVSSSMKDIPYPLRLSYCSSLYRALQTEGGRPAEFAQVGVELVGDHTASADGEMLLLLNRALIQAGLDHFQVAVGHIGFLNALFLEIVGTEERAELLRRQLYEKNDVGFKEQVKAFGLSSIDEKKLLKLSRLRGNEAILAEAEELTESPEGKQAVEELRDLWQGLKEGGLTRYMKLDLSLVLHMSYYTGCIFEVYHDRLPHPLGGGGRYDDLLAKFGRPGPATGFGLRLDLLAEAVGKLEAQPKKRCLLYSRERRQEAYRKATALREKGMQVVLQDVAGVDDIDKMSASYEEIVYLIGKTEEGKR